VTAASCASRDDGPLAPDGIDGSPDAPVDTNAGDDDATLDGGPKDSDVVDATPLAIECAAPPCATALSTTLRRDHNSREEGYCALLSDRTVACWGSNAAGQLGNGDLAIVDSPVPLRVPGLTNIVALDHTCAVDGDGAVWCWGRGAFLQSEAAATTIEPSPVRLPLPGPASKVSVGLDVGCAILRDTRVVCWGSNGGLQVDKDAPNSKRNEDPQPVELASGATDIAVSNASFALQDDGTMLSWGRKPALGRHASHYADGWPAPLQLDRVSMVDTIDDEACAVANGVGWCWGPIEATTGAYGPERALPIAVDTPEPITRIATSRAWTVTEHKVLTYERRRWCATAVSGTVYCWGLNNAGQAGDGTREFALAAVPVAGLPEPAAEVKLMPYSTCSILTNGKIWCWGNNFNGQLGADLPKGSVDAPVEVILP